MAASSPATGNNGTETPARTTMAAASAAVAAAASTPFHRTDTPPKTQRGLNKPKCIQCGNVARSRCPYRSCKSCCSKAQNPCHIHVLKANAAFPEKSPTSGTPSSDQKSTEVSSPGTSLRIPSLRQLSSAFAQFNNLHMPFRSKKQLTRKDAAALNEWRFSKLKEFRDRNVEVENEAFDRYMLNTSLLEEVFFVKSILEGSNEDDSPVSDPNSISKEGEAELMISGLKLKQISDPGRIDAFRKRIQQIIEQGLKKLQRCNADDDVNDINDQDKLDSVAKKPKSLQADKVLALNDIIDKLNKARNEDDLKSCLEMKANLYNWSTISSSRETKDLEASLVEQTTENGLSCKRIADYSFPKLFAAIETEQETIKKVDAHFSSLEQIEGL